jgi:hypothetical protein
MNDPDETRQPGLIVLCTVMLIIACVAVFLRFWSNRISHAHKFGYDDLFAFLALVSTLLSLRGGRQLMLL